MYEVKTASSRAYLSGRPASKKYLFSVFLFSVKKNPVNPGH